MKDSELQFDRRCHVLYTVGHFQRDNGHGVMLDEAEERTQRIDNGKENADLRDGRKINASHKAVGHDRSDPPDPVRAEDRHHRAERGKDQGHKNDAHTC